MKLIIDIPEEAKQAFDNAKNEDLYGNYYDRDSLIGKAIQNGTPIPDNVTNERMVGRWIKSRDCYGNYNFTCSECGNEITTQYADNWEDNYCSNCGARMEGVEYEKGYIL